MEDVVADIELLFKAYKKIAADRIEKLPQSGSDRIYFRIYAANETYIGTYNINKKENNTFISFTNHFRKAGLPMPQIFCFNIDETIYIQEDLGKDSLLEKLEQLGHNSYTYGLFKKSLQQLAKVQILGDNNLNYDLCLTAKEFGKQAILSDLLYFKYYFLDTLKTPYDKQELLNDFETLSTYLANVDYKYFMFR